MPSKTWLCPRRCGGKWPRSYVKCRTEGCEGRRPKIPVRAHQKALRDVAYAEYEKLNEQIHGPAMPGEWTADCCGACGKPRTQERKHDRDHDHRTGQARGLLCPGNQGCNVLLVPWVTAATAQGIAEAKQEAGEPDAERWALLAAYLRRVEAHRATQEATGGN